MQGGFIQKVRNPLSMITEKISKFNHRFTEKVREYFRNEAIQGDEGFLTVIAGLRTVVASVLIVTVILFPADYLSLNRTFGILYLLIYWLTSVYLPILRYKNPELFFSQSSKIFQVIFDTLSALILLSIQSYLESDLYILFLLPAVVAGTYFSLRGIFFTWLFIALTFFVTQFYINMTTLNAYGTLILLVRLWFPRMLVISAGVLFAFLYRKVKEFVLEDKQSIINEQLEIGAKLQVNLNIESLLHMLCAKAVQTIPGAQNSVLYLFDRESQSLIRNVSHPPNIKKGKSLIFRLGEGIAGIALKERQIINVPRVDRDERFIPKLGGRAYCSLLVAPLFVGEKFIGVISLDSPEPYAFNQLSEELLAMLATQASTALANALEFKERQQKYDQLHDILLFSQTKLKPENRIDTLLSKVLDGTREILGYESAKICLFGFILRHLPRFVLDEHFDMHKFIHNEELQEELLIYANENRHFAHHETDPDFSKVSYKRCVPLIGAENQAIGLLVIGRNHPFYRSHDESQAIWLYANSVAYEIQTSLSFELLTSLQETMVELEEVVNSRQAAVALQKFFQRLGFQRSVIKVASFSDEVEDYFVRSNVNDKEFAIIRNNFSRGVDWVKQHNEKLKNSRLQRHIGYYSWNDDWVRKEFNYNSIATENEKGFLLVQGKGSKLGRYIFEAVFAVTEDMTTPTVAWAQEFRFLIDPLARFVENVGITISQTADIAMRAEREWLQGDIHSILNIVQGGPLLFSEAARNELVIAQERGYFAEERIHSAIENLEKVEKAGKFVYDNLAQLMEELRQPTLRDKGLTEALKEFGENQNLNGHLKIDIESTQEKEIDIKTLYVLYRIAQEAISNVCKHAQIIGKDDGLVKVALNQSLNSPGVLVISDNGEGFAESVEEVKGRLTSFGIRYMGKWAKQINGELFINSDQAGTEVKVVFKESDHIRKL